MEEIREAALAYYENGSAEEKQLARNFFNCLDADGDGTVDSREFASIFSEEGGWRLMNENGFFRQLDGDSNGTLDFYEVLTFYYICKSRSRPFCDGCGIFLKSMFFTCVQCHDQSCSDNNTFDLCSKCYRGKKFRHQHVEFLDNYALLALKRGGGGRGQPNTTHSQSQMTTSASSNLTLGRGKSKRERGQEAFEAFNTGVTVGTYAFYAATACSIM